MTADSFFDLRRMTDTVVIEKERLSVKLFRQHDTLYVEGECKADTIIREQIIPVEKIRLVKSDITGMLIGKFPWLVTGLILLVVLRTILKRKTT